MKRTVRYMKKSFLEIVKNKLFIEYMEKFLSNDKNIFWIKDSFYFTFDWVKH